MSIKHDDLYAKTWESEYKQPISVAQNNNAKPPNSPENPVESDISTEEMRNTLGTAHQCSLETFPQTNEICDLANTYSDMETDVETSSEQPNKSPTNPAVPNTTYVLTRNLIATTTTDINS